jgi:hypothetical protein
MISLNVTFDDFHFVRLEIDMRICISNLIKYKLSKVTLLMIFIMNKKVDNR